MHFKNQALEQLFKNFKWTRNNTIKIFDAAIEQNILEFRSSSSKQSTHIFQPTLFQFQCIFITTDAYIRKITNHKIIAYGVYVTGEGVIIPKEKVLSADLKRLLQEQLRQLETILKEFDDVKTERYIDKIQTISNHEYLHQGELILMFREAGVELPQRFVRSWAL